MALSPDIIAEFVVGPECLRDEELEDIARQLEVGLSDLPLSPGSLSICVWNDSFNSNVVKIGAWTDTQGLTDDERRRELEETSILSSGRTAALLMTARLIDNIANAIWDEQDHTRGRVTLSSDLRVGLANGVIVTKVGGSYDVPLAPDVDFTFTARDTLSLTSSGSSPALSNDMSTDVDTDVFPLALLLGILSPVLGGFVFFAADSIAASQVPKKEGVGDALAAQWPSQVLTEINPPFVPGKFVLYWSELTVNETGILTTGIFLPSVREPSVAIRGSTSVSIREALGHAQVTYRLDLGDLRRPNISWGGAANGSSGTASVLFRRAGTQRISVNIVDADGLEVSDEITVRVTVIPLKDDQNQY